jgi:F-type H+-transporting ATPase subunit delta
VPVADTSQLISGVAERYASSLFELALDAGSIEAVGADLTRIQALIDGSDDLKRLIVSPVFSADDQFIKAFRLLAARHKGEITADVTSAHALTLAQEIELKAALKGVTGKDVAVNVTVDPSILGGLIVKVGSRQIDTSLRTKLSTLKLALKEVG